MTRAEQAAEEYFRGSNPYCENPEEEWEKEGFISGYEQAEKETIERAVEWLKENWREYVWTTDNGIPHFGHWERDFRKAMEDEK